MQPRYQGAVAYSTAFSAVFVPFPFRLAVKILDLSNYFVCLGWKDSAAILLHKKTSFFGGLRWFLVLFLFLPFTSPSNNVFVVLNTRNTCKKAIRYVI